MTDNPRPQSRLKLELYAASALDAASPEGSLPLLSRFDASISGAGQVAEAECWVGRRGGELIGWLAWENVAGTRPWPLPGCVGEDGAVALWGTLDQLATTSMPLLHALLERVLSRAASQDARRVWTLVSDQHTSIEPWWEGWGFVQVGQQRHEQANLRVLVRGLRRRTTGAVVRKIDEPFADDVMIETLVRQFEACEWPYERWTHRAHLAVGAWYVRQIGYSQALHAMRRHIRLYNQSRGDPDGYNETVTQLFLRQIDATLRSAPAAEPLAAIVERLAARCTVAWIYGYYSRERIWSRAAKREWLEPDLQPLTGFAD